MLSIDESYDGKLSVKHVQQTGAVGKGACTGPRNGRSHHGAESRSDYRTYPCNERMLSCDRSRRDDVDHWDSWTDARRTQRLEAPEIAPLRYIQVRQRTGSIFQDSSLRS